MSTLRVNTITDTSGGSSSLSVPGAAKAWVSFNGTGTVAIRASLNVSSITDNGTGDYTVNFTNALADANYAVTLGMSPQGGRWLCNYGGTFNNGSTSVTNSTGSVRVYVADINNGTADPTNAYVAIFR
jgi:hypothetical protein